MIDSIILGVGIFAFLMALVGVLLTVVEFKRTVLPKPEPKHRDSAVDAARTLAGHVR